MTLAEYQKNLAKLIQGIPNIMDKLVVGEARYARDQARRICKQDKIGENSSGTYRRSFENDTKAIRSGDEYSADVFNNVPYAIHLEFGFRRHFVPGHWEGNSFVYQPNDPEGGMTVELVPGLYTLKRAVKREEQTREARVTRRFHDFAKEYLEK